MTPEEYCREKAAPRGSSTYYSLLSLDSAQRGTLTALHAFRRETAEVVNECQDPHVARVKLNWWREETQRLFAGQPQHPVTHALAIHLDRYTLPPEYLQEIIDGVEMDLDYDAYPSFKELALYCHRVGSVFQLLATEVLGYQDCKTTVFAHELGIALQLTHILRKVRHNALKGRFYIPEDEMRRFSVSHSDLLQLHTPERVRDLFKFQAERVRDYECRAFEQLPDRDRYAQRSHIVLAKITMVLLNEIESENFRILEQRVSLTALRKFWIAWQTIRRERRHYRRHSVEP